MRDVNEDAPSTVASTPHPSHVQTHPPNRYTPLRPPNSNRERIILNHLPTELLLSVFTYALEEDAPVYTTRLRLTHVCRVWRNVVISYAPFWKCLALRPSDSTPHRLAMTQLDFERAKTCLDLDITIPSEVASTYAASWPDAPSIRLSFKKQLQGVEFFVISALDPEVIARIQVLRLRDVSSETRDLIQNQWDFSVPLQRLTELYLRPGWFHSIDIPAEANNLMRQILMVAESLRVLQLDSCTMPANVFPCSLRKLHLTRVTIGSDSDLLSMLTTMRELEQLVLFDRWPDPDLVPPAREDLSISLPRLRILALSPLYDIPDAFLLRALDCPNLKALHLQDNTDEYMPELPMIDSVPGENIMDAVASQPWMLEEICIHGIPGVDHLVIPFLLKHARSIRRLAITEKLYATARQTQGQTPFPEAEEIALRLERNHTEFVFGMTRRAPDASAGDLLPGWQWPMDPADPLELPDVPLAMSSEAKTERLETELRELLCSAEDDSGLVETTVPHRGKGRTNVRRVYLYAGLLYQSPQAINRVRNEHTKLALSPALCDNLYIGKPEWIY
ncbi:hypothetical protein CALVIDRAFT_601809 [Calocera viscosa TUFC12733]|uniref:F-box domain-containing protein n=1 Tax=Calocera viscosa (strain TUFC12733) TaxID=1330018 RepID=A0A167HTT7_CALVF|nr:hypothetical protein CALVIDRAFT_601809 [Calocera viscosa TUFC12733]